MTARPDWAPPPPPQQQRQSLPCPHRRLRRPAGGTAPRARRRRTRRPYLRGGTCRCRRPRGLEGPIPSRSESLCLTSEGTTMAEAARTELKRRWKQRPTFKDLRRRPSRTTSCRPSFTRSRPPTRSGTTSRWSYVPLRCRRPRSEATPAGDPISTTFPGRRPPNGRGGAVTIGQSTTTFDGPVPGDV